MSALKVHQGRSRRDVVSEAQLSCELFPVKGRVQDIRTHLQNKHQLDSYFMCMDSKCNFVCSVNFSVSHFMQSDSMENISKGVELI